MTRTEAIDLLDNLIGMVDDNHDSDYDTALKMGIKALEYDDAKYHEDHGEVIVDKAVWEDVKRALEQEPCEDAISREDVINLKWQGKASEEFLEGYASAIEDARVLPSVKPQQEDIAKDGTLTVRVADGRKVTRVLVCGDNHFGGLYYPDEDAEPQTGHWILSIEDWNKWTCSECGYSERTDIHVSLGYDYCPKCGVRMIESQEISDHNLKMWHDIYEEEKRRTGRSE